MILSRGVDPWSFKERASLQGTQLVPRVLERSFVRTQGRTRWVDA